ncbi:nuclear pore complex protein Nup50 isoform X2 [Dunckerocampus dactyliophorus]|uniref:nuclear pore complex protein Nup50 isoform X2 n=1 Tax=Dunckerocampus dactyliophorus TaxID=161453 RepID=UPI0024053A1D|nr:nuclear pore complex protein Nup50 isoform X2 [Dunckerocampus dactyliophorus]
MFVLCESSPAAFFHSETQTPLAFCFHIKQPRFSWFRELQLGSKGDQGAGGMAKRIADKELTDRNWDQEEEGEEAGTFSLASEDVLKNRAIKKAKRRNIGAEGDGVGAFKGFKGFSMSGGATPHPFSAFGNCSGFKGLGGLTNGNSITPSFGGSSLSPPAVTTPSMTAGLAFNGSVSASPSSDVTGKSSNGPASSSSSSSSSKEYSRQLTALNCSVRDWITKHVNDNPLCDLNPIFRDYERHLASIEQQYGTAASEEKKDGGMPLTGVASSSASGSLTVFPFCKDKTEDKGAPVPPGVTFNFGQKVDGSVLSSLGSKTTPPNFSFSGQSSLFGSASFSGTKSEDAKPADDNTGDESYEPPKPEVREVKEDNAFYSKKCKVFYKKEAEFKEKGVGTLHLKHTTEGKTQMIVRADTNLGNILLNILLHTTMPCSRVGKNNVMVVCVPNPPVDDDDPGSPVPLLIRVKTAEDADELHKTLEEQKG